MTLAQDMGRGNLASRQSRIRLQEVCHPYCSPWQFRQASYKPRSRSVCIFAYICGVHDHVVPRKDECAVKILKQSLKVLQPLLRWTRLLSRRPKAFCKTKRKRRNWSWNPWPDLPPALQQIGPRMELEIVKAEEGLCGGQVLYHQHIHKPAAEVAQKTRDIKDREELRVKRRKQQVTMLKLLPIDLVLIACRGSNKYYPKGFSSHRRVVKEISSAEGSM